MAERLHFKTTNTILYCQQWQTTVDFYRQVLNLPITHESDWFVEFQLTASAHLSVADERRATIKSSGGAGITLTFQVDDSKLCGRPCKPMAAHRGRSVITPGARKFSTCVIRKVTGWSFGHQRPFESSGVRSRRCMALMAASQAPAGQRPLIAAIS